MIILSGFSSEIVQNTMVKCYFHTDQCIQLLQSNYLTISIFQILILALYLQRRSDLSLGR
jgi:hypothetical protein